MQQSISTAFVDEVCGYPIPDPFSYLPPSHLPIDPSPCLPVDLPTCRPNHLATCPHLATYPLPTSLLQAFGDYNEKTFEDVATAEEAFDWMAGPLSDGLFPDELYNGMEMPQDKRGYVMSYNKVVGKVRLRRSP